MDQLIDKFDFSHCSKAGAKFDYEKGRWFNHEYLQMLSDESLARLFYLYFDTFDAFLYAGHSLVLAEQFGYVKHMGTFAFADHSKTESIHDIARVKEFLDVVNPRMAVFVKYEFWGNYLQELKRRGVPTYIISSIFRPSQIFFKPWGAMFRNMLRCYTHVYVQDERSRRLLAGMVSFQ